MMEVILSLGAKWGESHLGPYFWTRLVIGVLLFVVFVRILDRVIRNSRRSDE